ANGAPYQLQCGLKIVSRSQRVRLFVYTCDLPRAFLLQQKLFCGVEESCECRFARELRESRTPYPDSFFVIGFLDCFLERRCSSRNGLLALIFGLLSFDTIIEPRQRRLRRELVECFS